MMPKLNIKHILNILVKKLLADGFLFTDLEQKRRNNVAPVPS